MMTKKVFAAVFAALGLVAAALAVYIGANFTDREPILLTPPTVARSKVVAMMDAVCANDYGTAAGIIYGTPDLGINREAADPVGVLIWEAFESSVSYELVGECTPTATGVAQKVNVSYLDIASVTDGLQERFRTLLQQRVAAAEDVEEIYDENNNYRPDFVDGVVTDAAREALREDGEYVETELTVELVCIRGQWWILPDQTLMQVISGGTIPW